MPLDPWRVLERTPLLTASPWLEVFQEQVRLPDGRMIDDFYLIELPDFAVIAAALPDGRLIAQRRYKHGSRAVSLGLPGGYLESGEPPLEAAKRELVEEMGYESKRWRSLGQFVVDGNRRCGVAHFFLARDCVKTAEPHSDDLEEVQIELLSVDTVLDNLRRGHSMELTTAAAMGLVLLELQKHDE